jgi:hypothetical protein
LIFSLDVIALIKHFPYALAYSQEDRERMVVRRFKFEEPRMEQVQDLEVWFYTVLLVNYIGFLFQRFEISLAIFPNCRVT